MKLFNLEIRRIKNIMSLEEPDSYKLFENADNFYRKLTTRELLSNTTVASCVSLIADSIASLSCHVYKRTTHGRERDNNSSLSYVLQKRPNDFDTPFTFFQTVGLHLTLKGNAFLFCKRNPDFSIKSLTPLDPDAVTIRFTEKGDLYYEYLYNGSLYKYLPSEILHIPAYRYNTLRGMSPIEYANHAARLGLTLDEYTNESFDGGIQSKLVIEVPQSEKKFTKEDAQKLTERIMAANAGKENLNKPLILANGYKHSKLEMASNSDSQLSENRSFSEKEVAKIYRVPLYMLGKDDAKFTNNEQANTFFLQHTLTPWLVRLQQYLNLLLTYPYSENYYVEFDTDTMLRADYKSRMEMYIKGMQSSVYTPNQIYDMENLPRVKEPWGDMHFMPVNISTAEKIASQKLQNSGNEG